MKSKKVLTLLAAAGMVSAANAAVFTNTFDSGTDGWYSDINTVDDANFITPTNPAASDLIEWGSSNANLNHVIGKSFADTTLAVGQTLRFTADVTLANNQIFRIGLFDSGTQTISADNWAETLTGSTRGYYAFFSDNGTGVQRYQSSTLNSAAFTNTQAMTTGTTTSYDFAAATTYSILYEVTRTSETQVNTFASLSSGASVLNSVYGVTTTTANIVDSFDTVVFRGKGGYYSMDNATLELIPEPSAALLGGIGLLALLRRRRG